MQSTTRPPFAVLVTAIVVVLIGLYLAVGGGWLIALGGSPYYICTGVALIVTGILLFRSRAAALWLYAAILLGTLLWAIWEAGVDFWPLVPRGDMLGAARHLAADAVDQPQAVWRDAGAALGPARHPDPVIRCAGRVADPVGA